MVLVQINKMGIQNTTEVIIRSRISACQCLGTVEFKVAKRILSNECL